MSGGGASSSAVARCASVSFGTYLWRPLGVTWNVSLAPLGGDERRSSPCLESHTGFGAFETFKNPSRAVSMLGIVSLSTRCTLIRAFFLGSTAVPASACSPSSAPPQSPSAPTSSSTPPSGSEHPSRSAQFTCRPRGDGCQLDTQCCEGHCVKQAKTSVSYCKEPGANTTCRAEGHKCKTNNQCCSNNCVHDARLGRVCKPPGASITCLPRSSQCKLGSQCCSGTCISDARGINICK